MARDFFVENANTGVNVIATTTVDFLDFYPGTFLILDEALDTYTWHFASYYEGLMGGAPARIKVGPVGLTWGSSGVGTPGQGGRRVTLSLGAGDHVYDNVDMLNMSINRWIILHLGDYLVAYTTPTMIKVVSEPIP